MIVLNIGANSGMDDCRDFVLANKEYVSRVHLIEPSHHSLEQCRKNYSGISQAVFHEVAIVPDDSHAAILYSPKNQPESEHSSLIPNHTLYHGHKLIEGVAVKAISLPRFFQFNNITKCDRLYIDTEGMDCHILLALDFAKYKIDFIQFEALHSDGLATRGQNHAMLTKRLLGLGYSIRNNGEWNEIAEKVWNT